MLMKTHIYFILLGIFITATSAQAKNISGRVFDEENKLMPFVNITIKGYSIGTITNNQGYFSLTIPDSLSHKELTFSFIGYENYKCMIESVGDNLIVVMKQATVDLQEVIVSSNNTALSILHSAYKNIIENYGTRSSIHTGFYRESHELRDSVPLYLAEALIESYKTSYSNKQQGQVKVIKSRKNINPRASELTNTKYIEGLYFCHFADVVHNRWRPINPRDFKDFEYEYNGIYPYGDKQVHSFSYKSTKNKKQHGVFYIETESLAYVYFENHENRSKSTENAYFKIMYAQVDDIWFLKSGTMLVDREDKELDKTFALSMEYVTTNVAYDAPPIPYLEQASPTSIFSDIATEYKDSYWKDFNVLKLDTLSSNELQMHLNTARADSLLKKEHEETYTRKLSVSNIMHIFYTKIYYDLGISYTPYQFEANSLQLDYREQTFNYQNITNAKSPVFSLLIGYKLTKKYSLEFIERVNFSKEVAHKFKSFGMAYSIPIKRGGKQFFAQASLSYFHRYGGRLMGFSNLTNPTIISSKTFKKGANIYTGKREHGISTGILFRTNLTRRHHIVAGVNYHYPLSTKEVLLFEENKAIFKKRAYEKLGSSLKYHENSIPTNQSSFKLENLNFTIGLRFDLQ